MGGWEDPGLKNYLFHVYVARKYFSKLTVTEYIHRACVNIFFYHFLGGIYLKILSSLPPPCISNGRPLIMNKTISICTTHCFSVPHGSQVILPDEIHETCNSVTFYFMKKLIYQYSRKCILQKKLKLFTPKSYLVHELPAHIRK